MNSHDNVQEALREARAGKTRIVTLVSLDIAGPYITRVNAVMRVIWVALQALNPFSDGINGTVIVTARPNEEMEV